MLKIVTKCLKESHPVTLLSTFRLDVIRSQQLITYFVPLSAFLRATKVLPEDGRVPVEEVGGQVEHDRQLRQLLQQGSASDGRVIGSSTTDLKGSKNLKTFKKQLSWTIKDWFGGILNCILNAFLLNFHSSILQDLMHHR